MLRSAGRPPGGWLLGSNETAQQTGESIWKASAAEEKGLQKKSCADTDEIGEK
jgi:hypothetical protein